MATNGIYNKEEKDLAYKIHKLKMMSIVDKKEINKLKDKIKKSVIRRIYNDPSYKNNKCREKRIKQTIDILNGKNKKRRKQNGSI